MPRQRTTMSNKLPVFPVQEPQHFTDYGFEPQIDYFRVLEEARRHRRETTASRPSIDMNFKLQKPMPKDEASKKIKKNKSRRWWRNALLFLKFPRWAPPSAADTGARSRHSRSINNNNNYTRSISGPVYITESMAAGGSSAPYRTGRPGSSGSLVKGEVDVPYVSLRDGSNCRANSAAATPIYLVR